MLPQLTSMLTWWQWVLLATVPPAIIALYFLKLKRQPVEVPSTYLWHKSLEDLHVNSIWQRLRQSLLLLLQLILLGLLMIALLRPAWRSQRLAGDRFIFLIDHSASMSTTDVAPTRLAEAKRRALGLIDQMKSGDVAMVVSFADKARVEQAFTDNRKQLRRAIEGIRPTERSTSLTEALQVAAGLANPGRSATEASDVPVADAMPATVYILSDGRFPDVQGFALGNLKPVYIPIGQVDAANVGVTAFTFRRNDEKPEEMQVFARILNANSEALSLNVELYHDGNLIDAQKTDLEAGQSNGLIFDIHDLSPGTLELRLGVKDDFPLDDVAWAAVNPPSRARVLVVTPGNEPLRIALATDRMAQLAQIEFVEPAYLETPEYARQAAIGEFDLILYDRCAPKEMPQANTLFMASTPPGNDWKMTEAETPQIIDIDATHPLMQLLELWDVAIVEGFAIEPPQGGTVLVRSQRGPLMCIAARERFEDMVIGFALVRDSGANTNWPLRLSFPLFFLNVIEYLNLERNALANEGSVPGKPVTLRTLGPSDRVTVATPGGQRIRVEKGNQDELVFTDTDRVGIYEIRDSGGPSQRFAINLFNSFESDVRLSPQSSIKIGYVDVAGRRELNASPWQAWKPLLAAALAVLLIEWYIYNRRVYL